MSESAILVESSVRAIHAHSRRQAMDWSLVLVSQGIECRIAEPTAAAEWPLWVEANDQERALAAIRLYRLENRAWPWRRRLPQGGAVFDWGSLAWLALVMMFFWLQEHFPVVREAGIMDGAAVARGEWWRLFTAVFLHGDLGHMAMNAVFGVVLLGLALGGSGTGTGLLAAYLGGVLGNVASLTLYGATQRGLGASGMVMACVGLLAAQSLGHWRETWTRPRRALSGLATGGLIFLLLGTAPGTDLFAHAGGFAGGLLLGGLLAAVPRLARSPTANFALGGLFCFLVTLTWLLALAATQTRL